MKKKMKGKEGKTRDIYTHSSAFVHWFLTGLNGSQRGLYHTLITYARKRFFPPSQEVVANTIDFVPSKLLTIKRLSTVTVTG
jgi:hypothetical protein